MKRAIRSERAFMERALCSRFTNRAQARCEEAVELAKLSEVRCSIATRRAAYLALDLHTDRLAVATPAELRGDSDLRRDDPLATLHELAVVQARSQSDPSLGELQARVALR